MSPPATPRSDRRCRPSTEIDGFERRTVNVPRKVARTEHRRSDTQKRISGRIDHIRTRTKYR
ncbi:hypothetical protein C5B90_17430 [Haloferax sp. Atlit-12N]|nr:hypothetical protein C5B90_17430 [Haloferax sp. Atlit-12N]